MHKTKTNAMRILESMGFQYQVYSYESSDGKIDGISVAEKIGKTPEQVYKTILVKGMGREPYVFVLPVDAELPLKKAAAITGEKKLEMLPVKELLPWTGYMRGGCSPVGMKKKYKTYLDERALLLDEVIVSAGKVGLQIGLAPAALVRAVEARVEKLG